MGNYSATGRANSSPGRVKSITPLGNDFFGACNNVSLFLDPQWLRVLYDPMEYKLIMNLLICIFQTQQQHPAVSATLLKIARWRSPVKTSIYAMGKRTLFYCRLTSVEKSMTQLTHDNQMCIFLLSYQKVS